MQNYSVWQVLNAICVSSEAMFIAIRRHFPTPLLLWGAVLIWLESADAAYPVIGLRGYGSRRVGVGGLGLFSGASFLSGSVIRSSGRSFIPYRSLKGSRTLRKSRIRTRPIIVPTYSPMLYYPTFDRFGLYHLHQNYAKGEGRRLGQSEWPISGT